MSIGTVKMTNLLNVSLRVFNNILPIPIETQEPTLISAPIFQNELGVLIGVTGDLSGRLILEGSKQIFCDIGEIMFGMALQGDMLDSFVGELGNMIAGNLATDLYQSGITIDITPPTVIVGQTKLSGFHQAVNIPVSIKEVGNLSLVLALENKE